MKMKMLAAIILARDEEKNISDCIKSVSFADEIIVVDSGSRDKTALFARKNKAKVIKTQSGSYSDWRNLGLENATCKWVLYIDADERVSKDLREEILAITSGTGERGAAFAIPRENIILGKKLKHGGWYPDYVKRLFKKNAVEKWRGDLHEEPVLNGELKHLKSPIIHFKHDNLFGMVEKTNKWSEIEAKLMYKSGHPQMNVLRFLSAMFREFWLRMVKHKAFLDGSEGIIYAIYQVYSKFISYAKLWEMQEKNQLADSSREE